MPTTFWDFASTIGNDGRIISGSLVSPTGTAYPIINGIPRFVEYVPHKTVKSFGDQWNHFNFVDFKVNWLCHTVANTFGGTKGFAGRLIVDAGGGSGAQSKWFAEFGAGHVILLDLSHSVDDVVQRNLAGLTNVDVIQCSIDAPPIRDQCIDGIVYCHNVIQHTPSVEKTAHALFALAGQDGEFVFNCYPLNDQGMMRWVRFHLISKPLRYLISHLPFIFIMAYSHVMACLRTVPLLGIILEKAGFCVQGSIPQIPGESRRDRMKRSYKSTCLNTFDWCGSHKYQHYKSEGEMRTLVNELQPDPNKVMNAANYFSRPPPIGCALRLFR